MTEQVEIHGMEEHWNGRPTPLPPIYNFAIIPVVDQIDPLWAMKRGQLLVPEKKYEDIHIPRNTPLPLYIGILSLFFGFAMIWYIWWLAIASFVGMIICLIIRLSKEDKHDVITAAQVEQMEAEYVRRCLEIQATSTPRQSLGDG